MLEFVWDWVVGCDVGVVRDLSDWVFPARADKGFWIGFISGLSCAAVLMYWRVSIIQKRVANDVKAFA